MKKTLVARATGSDGRPAADVRLIFEDELPTYIDHRQAETAITNLFRKSFGERPVHVGSATLPWVPEDEGDDNGN